MQTLKSPAACVHLKRTIQNGASISPCRMTPLTGDIVTIAAAFANITNSFLTDEYFM